MTPAKKNWLREANRALKNMTVFFGDSTVFIELSFLLSLVVLQGGPGKNHTIDKRYRTIWIFKLMFRESKQ